MSTKLYEGHVTNESAIIRKKDIENIATIAVMTYMRKVIVQQIWVGFMLSTMIVAIDVGQKLLKETYRWWGDKWYGWVFDTIAKSGGFIVRIGIVLGFGAAYFLH